MARRLTGASYESDVPAGWPRELPLDARRAASYVATSASLVLPPVDGARPRAPGGRSPPCSSRCGPRRVVQARRCSPPRARWCWHGRRAKGRRPAVSGSPTSTATSPRSSVWAPIPSSASSTGSPPVPKPPRRRSTVSSSRSRPESGSSRAAVRRGCWRRSPRRRRAPRSRSRSATARSRPWSTAAPRTNRRRARWSRSPTSRSSCCGGAISRCATRCTRRCWRAPAGAVLLEETGRSLSATEVSDVLDVPVLARVPVKPVIARAVDAGVLPTRLPDPLARGASDLLQRTGLAPRAAGRGRVTLTTVSESSWAGGDAVLKQRVHRRLVADGAVADGMGDPIGAGDGALRARLAELLRDEQPLLGRGPVRAAPRGAHPRGRGSRARSNRCSPTPRSRRS